MKNGSKLKKLRGLQSSNHPSDFKPALKRKMIQRRSTIKIFNIAKPHVQPLRYGTAADHGRTGYMHNGKYCIGGYSL